MEFIPGPDFPTGGILQGKDEIKKAYETGRGKVILRSKTKIEAIKGNKQQIVISEIPYEVNKATLVKKMDEIRLNKKIDGIAEVRDESDRTGLQIVVELKKDANAPGILNYLFKNTELQINYNFNMVAIDHMTPHQVGLEDILSSYIDHRKQVITKRSQFDLEKAQKRQHIVEGLMKALSILDEVIATIRESKDKKDAKKNLVDVFQFTEEQAEAIVTLQLYRLTNTDITELRAESESLIAQITELNKILSDDKELFSVMKKELREVKKKYANARMTKIEDEIEEIKIDTKVLVAQEDVIVSVTREGYVKRTSLRSYSASKPEEIGMREGDYLLYSGELNTLDHLLLVTNKANVIYRPVHELPDLKWKDAGEHISQTILNLSVDESILAVFPYKKIDPEKTFVFISKQGWIKQTRMTEFEPWRTYKSRPLSGMKLKSEDDELVAVYLEDGQTGLDVFLVTHQGMGLRYPLQEVPVVGTKAAGVKSINLKEEDIVVNGLLVIAEGDTPIVIVTQRGAVKRMLAQEISQTSRAKRGVTVLRELKKNPHRIIYMSEGKSKEMTVINQKGQELVIDPTDYPIGDRTSNGSFAMDEKSGGEVIKVIDSPEISIDE